MAKAPIKITNELSREDVKKMLKSIKGSQSIIGKEEITELCFVESLGTDIPTLDFIGGLTKNRVNLLAGNPSSCKSTLTQQIIPQIINEIKANNENKFILYFDIEGAYDVKYTTKLGIDQDYMIIKRSIKVMEDCFKEAADLMKTGFIKAVIFDSFDAMVPRKISNSDFGETMGSQSGAIANHFPSVFSEIETQKVTCFIIKQARVKFGVQSHGEVITFNGGKALRHICDNIFILKRKSNLNLTYVPIAIKAEKTRSSRMGITLELPLGECGIDKVRDLMNICISVGLVKGGSWPTFTAKDGTVYQEHGSDKFLKLIKENSEIYKELKDLFYSEYVNNDELIVASVDDFVVDLDNELVAED